MKKRPSSVYLDVSRDDVQRFCALQGWRILGFRTVEWNESYLTTGALADRYDTLSGRELRRFIATQYLPLSERIIVTRR